MTVENELRIIGNYIAGVTEGNETEARELLDLMRTTLIENGHEGGYNLFRDTFIDLDGGE